MIPNFIILIFVFKVPSAGYAVTVLAIIAKTTGNVGWFVNFVQTMEIYPTAARLSGMNLAAGPPLLFGLATPYVVLLGEKSSSRYFRKTYAKCSFHVCPSPSGDSNLPAMYSIFALVGVCGVVGKRKSFIII